MIREQRTEDRGQMIVCRYAARATRLRLCGKAATKPLSSVLCPLSSERGFTLVEMIMVIVITGIIGGMVAVFLKAPVQQYMDVARRADMTDIADTALRRVTRDLRMSLPNSVRVRNAAGTPCNGAQACYLEFIPTIGGGRYRVSTDNLGAGNTLDFSAPDTTFDVLGQMPTVPPVAVGDQIVVYNLGISDATRGSNAYDGFTTTAHNRRAVTGVAGNVITIASANALPFDSCVYDATGFVVGGCRFQVVQTAVTYVCIPVAGGTGGTLTRWQGYTIQAAQPIALPATGTPSSALLANNVSACAFSYDANVVAQRSGLVTMSLAITRDAETVTLYNAAHVSNQP
jgi:MSHA biogenesis protein MshO